MWDSNPVYPDHFTATTFSITSKELGKGRNSLSQGRVNCAEEKL